MRNKFKYLTITVSLLFVFCSGFGQEYFGIGINGFASQGYLRSTENNYLGKSKDGSFEFNEVGINFQKNLTENLRVGLQLFARDLGSQGNDEVIIDWALLDYKWRSFLNVRVGKIKLPIGLYNEERDIDLLRTSILLPQSVYNEPQREVLSALEGMSLYGSFDMKKFGSIDYNILVGSISTNPEAPFIKDPYLSNVDSAASLATSGLSAVPGFVDVNSLTGNSKVDVNHLIVLQLVYNTPLEGFKIGGSYYETDLEFSGDFALVTNFTNPADPSGTSIISSISKISFFNEITLRSGVVSMEYIWKDLTLSAEAMLQAWWVENIRRDNEVAGFYLSASYQFNDKFAFGAYYSVLYEDLGNKDGSNLVALGRNDFEGFQKDFAITGRYDVNEYLVIKAEVHIINGTADVSYVDNLVNPLKEDWVLFALKTTISF
ncbi:MAG: hypothetical protein COA79_19920 [Planctomycetota bacterium]|nr:MAG: hypothetical protein COA79_19920 [Planctomycetota bacterium]